MASRELAELLQAHLGTPVDDVVGALRLVLQRRSDVEQQAEDRAVLLASQLVHQLRTPLSALHLQMQRIPHLGPLNDEQQEVLRRTTDTAQRMAELISGVLALSRHEAKATTSDEEPFDIVALARSTCDSMRPWSEDKGVGIELSTSHPASSLEANPALVRLVLTNLLENAVKFSEGGRVSVEVLDREDDIALIVSDDGPGIHQDDRGRIFDTFERLDATEPEGNGIGLALVRRAVAVLGGRIAVASDDGASFSITLPRQADRGASPR